MTNELEQRRRLKKFIDDHRNGVPFGKALMQLCNREEVDAISNKLIDVIDDALDQDKRNGDIAMAIATAAACFAKTSNAPTGAFEAMYGIALQLLDEATSEKTDG